MRSILSEHPSCGFWSSVGVPYRNVYLDLILIFWSGCLFFDIELFELFECFGDESVRCLICKYCPPFCGFSTVLFMISCAVQRLLSLIRSRLLTFDFSFITLRGGSKKIHCCDLWQSVVPVFSSKSFIMSVLMLSL